MSDLFRDLVSRLAAAPTETYPLAGELMASLANVAQVQFFEATGTGANIDVTVQGTPRAVVGINITQECLFAHIAGMADASHMEIDNAATAYVSSAGVTLSENNVRIGTDATINTASDEIFLMVIV